MSERTFLDLGGEAYRVFVSHEEGLFGPPTQIDEGRAAVLQRLSDNMVSNDIPFVVPLEERQPKRTGPVLIPEPIWW